VVYRIAAVLLKLLKTIYRTGCCKRKEKAMRGNYQEEEPPMKFTPESSATSEIYQVQHYAAQPDLQENFVVVSVSEPSIEMLS
jgi:hypothetical protein